MIVDAALYTKGTRHLEPFTLEGALRLSAEDDTFSWIGLFEPTEEEFEAVRREYDLHELAVEDAVRAHQRPKLELYGNVLFVVLKPARYIDPAEVIELGEILMFIGQHFVIVVRHGEAGELVQVRHALEADPEELSEGPAAVLLAVLDRVIDDYAHVLSNLEVDIQELEAAVFSEEEPPTKRIYQLKREVLQFQQATEPLLEPLEQMARGRYAIVHPDLRHYFRDVHDHLLRVTDRVAGYRDLLTSILEANLTQVSLQQNADMRKISAWVAIAAVPTLLAGVWGMNFRSMPEIGWSYGYPMAIGAMLAICLLLFWRFRKSGWL